MPTKKQRLTFALSDAELGALEHYQQRHGLKNVSQTILTLLRRGLTADGLAPLSAEAAALAAAYDGLDDYGRDAVRELAALEQARCADEARFLRESVPEPEPRVINLFEDPAAAGLALAQTGQEATPYVLGPEDPPAAAYAVRVRGDSMAPWYPDGSVVFVNHDQMRPGDVGVFCVDGAAVIKQWYVDPLGVTYLFSLNRRRSDADLVIGPGRSVVWQGRVITRRHFPLPE